MVNYGQREVSLLSQMHGYFKTFYEESKFEVYF